MDACTFACVPGSVKTFSNVPSLSLYHQNGKGHLTHGAKVSRGWSLGTIVCLTCVISRRGLGGLIMCLCTAISVYRYVNNSTTIPIFICLDFGVSWLDWGFSGNTSSFRHSCGCRQWFTSLLFLLERFIFPNVIFRVVLLWHLEKNKAQRNPNDFFKTSVITQGLTSDNIPR